MRKGYGVSIVFGLIIWGTVQVCSAMNVNNVTITGEINAIAKVQKSYQSPLDLFGVREGANYRSEQSFRGFGNMILSYGSPADEWFAAAKIEFDANDPDLKDDDYYDEPASEDYRTHNNNQSEYNFTMEYAFVMYRPFEMRGGRPFGIMAGMIPLKATANAAYFTFFRADPEEDFILYTCTALTEVPGIGLDFHISDTTGIGVAFTRGVKDASELGTLIKTDSAENWVFWAEAGEYNFGFNFAYQVVKGEGEPSDIWTTPSGNVLYEFNQPYSHYLLNTMLTYTFGWGNLKFTPAVGYQRVAGEECMAVEGYDPRDVAISTYSYGLKIDTHFFNIPGELSFLYTDVPDLEKFEGVKTIPKGTLADVLPGLPDIPEEGKGHGILALMEVESDFHAEYVLKVNPHTEVGVFFYQVKTVNDRTKEAAYIRDQLQPTLI